MWHTNIQHYKTDQKSNFTQMSDENLNRADKILKTEIELQEYAITIIKQLGTSFKICMGKN